jgi:hypothetical protein
MLRVAVLIGSTSLSGSTDMGGPNSRTLRYEIQVGSHPKQRSHRSSCYASLVEPTVALRCDGEDAKQQPTRCKATLHRRLPKQLMEC